MTAPPKQILLLDDNPAALHFVRDLVQADPRLCLAGETAHLNLARTLVARATPDGAVLNVDIAGSDGLDFLRWLMRDHRIPVVVFSSRKEGLTDAARHAVSMGALGCFELRRVQQDPTARALFLDALASGSRAGTATVSVLPPPAKRVEKAILIGSSTGGVDALERVLVHFPADCPPVVIAQHMPASFLRNFRTRLNDILAPRVRLAQDGEPLRRGTILIGGGGDCHVALRRGKPLRIQTPPVEGHEAYVPLVDKLFASGEPHATDIVACLLTGMGRDGADAMLDLRRAGARTVVQSGDSCVVDGMPRAARENGAAEFSVALDDLGRALLRLASTRKETALG